MENKRNIPQVGKVTLFKPRVGKVISGQTTSKFSVTIPNTFMFLFILFYYYNKIYQFCFGDLIFFTQYTTNNNNNNNNVFYFRILDFLFISDNS